MAEKPFELDCPCCGAKLLIDPGVRAVLRHDPPPKRGGTADLDQAVKALQGESARREARFQRTVDAERGKGKVLERKFEEGLKRAKDDPSRPLRPIDLD
jgi:hypothetical protein